MHSVAEANILGIYLSYIRPITDCYICFFEMQSEQLLYNLYLHIIHILDPPKKDLTLILGKLQFITYDSCQNIPIYIDNTQGGR